MRDAGIFSFIAMPESLSAARSCVRGFLQGCHLADKEMDVNIVVGEILQNVIRYGFDGGSETGHFTMQFFIGERHFEIVVTDTAKPSNPDEWSNEHRAPEEGGHGLTLVNAIAEEVLFEMLDNGNRATIKFAFD